MGGISNGLQDPTTINMQNPASFAAINATTLELGVNSSTLRLSNNSVDQVSLNASMSYLGFAFPISKKWGLSFGLLPYSRVGYKIVDEQTAQTDIGDIPVNYIYSGEGGLSKFYIGNGFKLTKNLYAGFNASYLFGNVSHLRISEYPDTVLSINTRINNSVYIGDVYLDYGLQYKIALAEKKKIVLGYSGALAQRLGARSTTLADRYYYLGTRMYTLDTVQYTVGEKSSVTLPMTHSLGFSFQKENHWLIGLDAYYGNWSDYRSSFDAYRLSNSMGLAIGGQIIPKYTAIGNYLKNIEYRAGAHAGRNPLTINNTAIDEVGASVGFGLPLVKVRSKVNIAAEYLRRGTTNNNLLKEEYLNFHLSFILNDTWFQRRKYD